MAIPLSDNIQNNSNKPDSNKYGPWNSVAEAVASPFLQLAYRHLGLTIGIKSGNTVQEYWWNTTDLSNTGLVVKVSGSGTGGDTISGITLGANNILTVATDKGNKTVDLSRLDVKGDTIQSVALVNSVLRIVTDQGTYQADLSSLATNTGGTPTAGDTVTAFGLSSATNLRLTTDKGTFDVNLSAFAVKGDTISAFTLANNILTLSTDQGTRTVDLSVYATTSFVTTELAKKENLIGAKGTAFNKDFGTTAGTVAEGNHNHDTRYIRTVNGVGPDATGNVTVSGSSGTATNSLQKQSYTVTTAGAQTFALPSGAVGFTNVNFKDKNAGITLPIYEGNLTLSNGNLLVAASSDFEAEVGDIITVEWLVGGLAGGGTAGGDTIQSFTRVNDLLRIVTDKATRDADLSDFRDYSKLFNKPAAPDLSNYATFTYVNTELGKKSNTVHTHTADQITNFNSAADARIEAQKIYPGSLATIDPATGKLYLALVPGQTREVFPFNSRSAFPTTGDPNALYIARDERRTYVWDGTGYTAIDASAVLSVNGKTGNVTITKADVGLGNVDNTSDLNKPISTATQNALNQKANSADLKQVAYSGDYNDLTNRPAPVDISGKADKTYVDQQDALLVPYVGTTTDKRITGDLWIGDLKGLRWSTGSYIRTKSTRYFNPDGSDYYLFDIETVSDGALTYKFKRSAFFDSESGRILTLNAATNRAEFAQLPLTPQSLADQKLAIATTAGPGMFVTVAVGDDRYALKGQGGGGGTYTDEQARAANDARFDQNETVLDNHGNRITDLENTRLNVARMVTRRNGNSLTYFDDLPTALLQGGGEFTVQHDVVTLTQNATVVPGASLSVRRLILGDGVTLTIREGAALYGTIERQGTGQLRFADPTGTGNSTLSGALRAPIVLDSARLVLRGVSEQVTGPWISGSGRLEIYPDCDSEFSLVTYTLSPLDVSEVPSTILIHYLLQGGQGGQESVRDIALVPEAKQNEVVAANQPFYPESDESMLGREIVDDRDPDAGYLYTCKVSSNKDANGNNTYTWVRIAIL
jgi:hypothetical protein